MERKYWFALFLYLLQQPALHKHLSNKSMNQWFLITSSFHLISLPSITLPRQE